MASPTLYYLTSEATSRLQRPVVQDTKTELFADREAFWRQREESARRGTTSNPYYGQVTGLEHVKETTISKTDWTRD